MAAEIYTDLEGRHLLAGAQAALNSLI